jgi:hypothetical protein
MQSLALKGMMEVTYYLWPFKVNFAKDRFT